MTKNRMNIQARVATLPTHELMDINGWNKKHDIWNIMLIPIRIKVQTKNTPKNLLASETWRLFGDLGRSFPFIFVNFNGFNYLVLLYS